MHLEDTYYSGTSEGNRGTLSRWLADAGSEPALNGNHDASGDSGIADSPRIQTVRLLLLLQNAHRLAGLDTAYVDHDMDTSRSPG
jgi:hypothetical protein